MSQAEPGKKWGAGALALFIILPLLAGVLLSLLIPRPTVGVIYLDDAIYSTTAQDMIDQITYAREHSNIKAVVLVLNSPGGTVADSESVYLELAKLRAEKPVVTSVETMAASGAYYLSVGTDYIIARASSEVGNIGVLGYVPSKPSVDDYIYSTGPYKLWGSSQDAFVREIEVMKEGFWQAVQLGRGDALLAPKEVVMSGQIWSGSEALNLGIIDALGSRTDAFAKAARMAHIAHYRVENLRQLAGLPEIVAYPFYFMTEDGQNTGYPNQAGIYFLYIPQLEVHP